VIDEAVAAPVLAAIDRSEVVALALALGGIDSPAGSEGAAGEFVHEWMLREGFAPRKVGLAPTDSTWSGA
jgi:formylaminopyrimidine deformylase